MVNDEYWMLLQRIEIDNLDEHDSAFYEEHGLSLQRSRGYDIEEQRFIERILECSEADKAVAQVPSSATD
jgi:hypothetical protein